jgi:hypothetical protein
MRRQEPIRIRDAARATRRDLRILLLLTAIVVSVFLVTLPGRSADGEEQQDPLEEFDPTEEVKADRPVAFPVDI